MKNVHLIIPSLFWEKFPPHKINNNLSLPALESLLAKSTQSQQPSEGLEAWLCHTFGITKQQNWPIAPILLQAENVPQVSTGSDYWLRADPAHLRIEQNHILLADSQMFEISVKESKQLADIVNQHFAKDNLVFLPISADRWYVRLKEAPNITLRTLDQTVGTNINNFLPSGEDKVIWHNRFNEIQMLLHENTINQTRQSHNELAINSLWFWGGGILPQSIDSAYTQIWSNSFLPYALALASNTHHNNLPANANIWKETAEDGNHLILFDTLWKRTQYNNTYGWIEALNELEQNWLSPLQIALKKNQITSLTLTTIEEDSVKNFNVIRSNLRRFWRKIKPFSSYLK